MKPFTWLVGGPYLRFDTPLSPEEFTARFQERVDRPRIIPFAGYWGSTSILGTMAGGSFRLQERIPYRNSGLPFCYGQIHAAENGGVWFDVCFRPHPLATVLMVGLFWLGFLLVSALVVTFAIEVWNGKAGSLWLLITASVVDLLLVAAALTTTVISKKKEVMYVAFFQETFDATPVDRRD